jgi:hypothetical protein
MKPSTSLKHVEENLSSITSNGIVGEMSVINGNLEEDNICSFI